MCTVPGAVFNLTGQPRFTFIVLAPQDPNGVIISYEVTYKGNDDIVTTNTTDLSTTFTISSLTPGTNVTEISVSAYINVGRGDPVQISHLTLEELPRELIDHFFLTDRALISLFFHHVFTTHGHSCGHEC